MGSTIEWLMQERGISEEAIEHFGVKETAAGLVFPYPEGEKRRFLDSDGHRRFTFTPGITPGLFGPRTKAKTVYLCEGETDALRLWTELPGMLRGSVDVLALSGIETWRPELAATFAGADQVLVVLDNDEDYAVQGRVDKVWRDIRKDLGPRAKRIYLPSGSVHVKDVCDFFDTFDFDDFGELLSKSARHFHYNALDLLTDPKPPDWLVENLVCKGDLSMMIGEPGIGKSWLSMSLAVAIAEQQRTWLGREILPNEGRVVYVDEENPERLVPYRLRKLGLTDEGTKNIRYLHRQGIRLDRNPTGLLDEALEFQPTLLVLDSLTRVHTKDENNAGEIARLFNDAIVPLARETGATVLVLHHVTKSESSSSFVRARGSGDISASIDTGLDVRDGGPGGFFKVALYKSRWIEEGASIRGQRLDTPTGGTEIVATERGFSF